MLFQKKTSPTSCPRQHWCCISLDVDVFNGNKDCTTGTVQHYNKVFEQWGKMSTHNQVGKEESHHDEPMGDRSQEQSENVIVPDAEKAGENTEGRDDEADEQSENSVEVPDGEEPGENPEGADGSEDSLVLENV